jgi:hypothetical protein
LETIFLPVVEERLKGFDGSLFARPEQAGNIEVRTQKERPHA